MVKVITLMDIAEQLGIPTLWNKGLTGKGIKVAVIDSGVNSNHPMLKGKVVFKHNFTEGDIEDGIIGHGCTAPDTYTYTSVGGVSTIEQLYTQLETKYESKPSEIGTSIYPTEHIETISINSKGYQKDNILAIHKIPINNEIISIKASGVTIKVTPWHPCIIIRNNQYMKIRADNITLNDKMIMPTGDNLLDMSTNIIDTDMAWVYGYFIADGGLMNSPRISVYFTDSNIENLEKVKRILKTDAVPHKHSTNAYRLIIYKKEILDLFLKYFKPGIKTYTITIPTDIITSGKESIYSCIAGLFDGDGYIATKIRDKNPNNIEITFANKNLSEQLCFLLNCMGVRSRINKKKTDVTRADIYRNIIWNIDNIELFYKFCGKYIQCKHKQDRFNATISNTHRNVSNRINRNYDGFRAESIESIDTYNYSGYFYDFTTEKYHNYVAGSFGAMFISNTWIASAIAGNMVTTSQGDMCGLAPDVQIYNIKVLDDNGEGLFSQIIEGIYMAVEQGCHIINMSLGSDYDDGGDSPVSQAIDYATGKGVICICAAGNQGPGRAPNTPATARTAIAVGSANTRNEVSSFSSRGVAKNKNPFPTICAYGGESTSAGGYDDESILGAYIGSAYVNFKGTSMATPMISATVALMLSANGSMTYNSFMDVLKTTSIDISTAGVDVNSGYGLINPTAVYSLAGTTGIATLIKYSALMGASYYMYKHITKGY